MTGAAPEAPRGDDGLRLELLFGKAVVTGEDLELGPWSRLTEVRAEIPGRRFPFDLGSEPDRFRGTRTVASALSIEVDGARLAQTVSSLARTVPGVADIGVELLADEIRIAIELVSDAGAGSGRLVVRLALVPDITYGPELHLVAFDYLALGELPEPAPTLYGRVLGALLEAPEVRPVVDALTPRRDGDTLAIAAARLCLSEVFVRRGWKIPGSERLRWILVTVGPGRATLTARAADDEGGLEPLRGPDPRNRPAAIAGQEMRAVVAGAESALFAGDTEAAIEGYRAALERYGGHDFLRARALGTLLASPAHTDEARSLVADILSTIPDDIQALAASVTLAARAGDVDGTLVGCDALDAALARAGREEDRVDALLFASRVAASRKAAEGTAFVRRALRLAPRSAAVLRQHVRLARASGDVAAYEDGLTRLLALARRRSTRARLHREIARVARQQHGDLDTARAHLTEAVILAGNDPRVLVELATTSEESGRFAEAVRTFRTAAARLARDDPGAAADTFARAGRIWETRLSDPGNAVVDVQSALALAPNRPDLLLALVRTAAATGDGGLTARAVSTATARMDRSSPDGRAAMDEVLAIEAGRSSGAATPHGAAAGMDGPHGAAGAPATGAEATSSRPRERQRPQPPAPTAALDGETAVPGTPVVTAAADSSSLPAWTALPPEPTPEAKAQAAERADRVAAKLAEARKSGNPEELADVLPEAAECESDAAERAALLAELGCLLYYDLEDSARARQYLEEAQRLDPDGAGGDYGLLGALEAIYEDAASGEGLLAIYDAKLKQAGTEDIRVVYRLLMAGVLFDQLGRPAEAVELLDEVLAAEPRNIPALRLRARVWGSIGRRADAAGALADLIAMPEIDLFDRQDLLRELGRLEWQALDRFDRAAERFEMLLGEVPGDTDCISSLKQIYARAERWDRVVDVLRRELGILAGAPDAFADLAAAAGTDPDRLPEPLRPTFGRILTEAAMVTAQHGAGPAAALDTVRAAARLAPEDIFVHEQLLELALEAGAHGDVMGAAQVIGPQLIDPDERSRLDQRVRAAAAATGRRGASDDASANSDQTGPVGPNRPDPETGPATRLDRLDELAAKGNYAKAIAGIDAWLPAARRPALRRELLLRKGRWLLDRGVDVRSAVLPLKGALILDPSAPETRLELCRASCRLEEAAQAMDQLREYLEARSGGAPLDDWEKRRVAAVIDDLAAMPRGPGRDALEALVADRLPSAGQGRGH